MSILCLQALRNPSTIQWNLSMLQEWQLHGSCGDVSVLLSSTQMGSVCSSPTLVAKGRGLEFKPQLCIPGLCYPCNQSSELKQKLKQGSLSPVQSKNFLLSLA